MKRIKVLFTSPDGVTTASEAIMFDDTTILQIEGDEWFWLGFAFPVTITGENELRLDDHSMYSVLNLPAIKTDPAEVEKMSATEYIHFVVRALIEEIEQSSLDDSNDC